MIPFDPLPYLSSGFWQTVLGSYGLPLRDPPSSKFVVPVTDGDELICLESRPPGWTPQLPTFVLTHGLGGSSRSRYMVRLSRFLYRKGQRVIRVNFRGCGIGKGFARKPAHGGRSDDLLAVCHQLKRLNPESDLRVVGFSLSGNILLKMLGELGSAGVPLVERALAICPSVDLKASATFIAQPENRVFEEYYLRYMVERVVEKQKIYPDFPKIVFPDPLSMYTFDDLYTAPLSGFQNADDYYDHCSCKNLVHLIKVPTTILYSLDDPILPAHPIEQLRISSSVKAYATEHGGHVGFLGWVGPKFWFRWMDKKIIEWLDDSLL